MPPKVTPTNTLILLLPPRLFSPSLLPLFSSHFATYGTMVSWTPLEKLGRVLVVYEEMESARDARREMDGFVWVDEVGDGLDETVGVVQDGVEEEEALPLRAFFGPSLSLPLPSLHSTLLSVPALSRNFLISPPGSPPVGWEQTLEEAPNANPLPSSSGEEGGGDGGWGEELARALRFLSVDTGEDGDEVEGEETIGRAEDDAEGREQRSTTQLIVPPSSSSAEQSARPSITVSTPPILARPFAGGAEEDGETSRGTPPPGASKITAVKATIESLLGRKRSFGDLGAGLSRGEEDGGGGGGRGRITPTARPPTAEEMEYRE